MSTGIRKLIVVTAFGVLAWPFIVAGFIGMLIGHGINVGRSLYESVWKVWEE